MILISVVAAADRIVWRAFEIETQLAHHLHRALRGIAYDGIDRSLDLRVSRVRRKLGDAGAHIKSVRGVGYLWAPAP